MLRMTKINDMRQLGFAGWVFVGNVGLVNGPWYELWANFLMSDMAFWIQALVIVYNLYKHKVKACCNLNVLRTPTWVN